jgi:hypothetical protein
MRIYRIGGILPILFGTAIAKSIPRSQDVGQNSREAAKTYSWG